MKVNVKKIVKKVFLSLLVVIVLSLIAFVVVVIKKYYRSDSGLTSKYKKELNGVIPFTEGKKIIKIVKSDINLDGIDDYFILYGEPKYEELDNTKIKFFQSLNSNLELYNNVSVEFVNGDTKQTNMYNTNRFYSPELDMKVIDSKYIIVDDLTGNVALLYLNNDTLDNMVNKLVNEKEFVGYTIEGEFEESDDSGVALKVKLDNYGKEYLQNKTDTYTLDYNNTNVNSQNYRLTYMANKFSKFEVVKSDEGDNYYLVCTQYILYSNSTLLNKNEGYVETKFAINSDNSLTFSSVEVKK